MPVMAHKYRPGDRLLCFEPDLSKAKLIYHAEVTALCGFTSKGRFREPQYFVHFLGWKRKWDREVCEDLLLDSSEFNLNLKRKIDEIATNVKDKEKRIERIDQILSSAATASDDIDWESVPGVWKGTDQASRGQSVQNQVEAGENVAKSEPQSPQSISEYPEEPEDMTVDAIAHANFEAIDDHKKFSPNVELPQSLFAILETHCRPFEDQTYVHSKRSQKLQSWCCVFDLLQSYVHGFPYNLSISNPVLHVTSNSAQFSSTSQRERFSRMAAAEYLKTDRSRHLCAEFCSSVRILFDALLVDYLLYPSEEKQHIPFVRKGRNTLSSQTASTLLPTGSQFTLLPPEEIEASPSLPCLTYEAIYLLRLLVRLPALVNQMALSKCRRSIVLRHLALFISYLDGSREFWFTDVRPSAPNPQLLQSQQTKQHNPRNSSVFTPSDSSSAISAIPSHSTPNRSRSSMAAISPKKRSSSSLTKLRSHIKSSSGSLRHSPMVSDVKKKSGQSSPTRPIHVPNPETPSVGAVPAQSMHNSLGSSPRATVVKPTRLLRQRSLKKEDESKIPAKQPRILRGSLLPASPLPPQPQPKVKLEASRSSKSANSTPFPRRNSLPTTVKSTQLKKDRTTVEAMPIANRTRMRSMHSP